MVSGHIFVFVDFEKAFDRLCHKSICESLQRKGVPDKITRILQAQYAQFQCKVLHDGALSEPIETVAGVRQGCILSLLLFLMVLDDVLHNALDTSPGRGILLNPISLEHLEDLDYADDIVLLSQHGGHMQKNSTT